MFALALAMKIDADDDMTCTLTFHESEAVAREKIISTILEYTGPHIKTIDDFVAELVKTTGLGMANVYSMGAAELIEWVKTEAVGSDCQLKYEIKKLPA